MCNFLNGFSAVYLKPIVGDEKTGLMSLSTGFPRAL